MATVAKLKDATPSHLSSEAAGWWRRITREYQIDDDGGLLLLQTALEAFDRMRGAQAAIERDGATVRGSTKQIVAHPLIAVERDARAQMLSAIKQLNLDLEPLRDRPGRPGGL
jgi:P27 family predicted phage terminase small subunit